MFAHIRQHPLSGNRESWSELRRLDTGYAHLSGQTDSPEVYSRGVSEDEAWRYLRNRAMEGIGLFTFKEQASARPEAILDYFRSIWRGHLPEGWS